MSRVLGASVSDLIARGSPIPPPNVPIRQIEAQHLYGDWLGMTPEGYPFLAQHVRDGRWLLYNGRVGTRLPLTDRDRVQVSLRWHIERQAGRTFIITQHVNQGSVVQREEMEITSFNGVNMATRHMRSGLTTQLRRSNRMACGDVIRNLDLVWRISINPGEYFPHFDTRRRQATATRKQFTALKQYVRDAAERSCAKVIPDPTDLAFKYSFAFLCEAGLAVAAGTGGGASPLIVPACVVSGALNAKEAYDTILWALSVLDLSREIDRIQRSGYANELEAAVAYANAVGEVNQRLQKYYEDQLRELDRLQCVQFDRSATSAGAWPTVNEDGASGGSFFFSVPATAYLRGPRPFGSSARVDRVPPVRAN